MASPYENRSKDELLELAAERDVEGRSSMSKAELVAALRGESDDAAADEAAVDDSPGFESDTPSALALKKVGPDGDGEAYQAEKRKHRWGP